VSPRLFASPADAARQVAGLIRHGRALGDAVLRGRLSADERELVAVAVSRVNACAGCTFVHERWALRADVSDDDLRALELGELQNLDARKRALVAYASARVEDRFSEPVPAGMAEAVHASLTPGELAAADALARAMTLANLTTSTAAAMLARVRGSDRETDRRRDSVGATRDRKD
jgi:AhpD family alkylhydroperoxidase